jgi:hypothetical protein
LVQVLRVGFEEFKADRKVEESGVQMPGDVVEAGLQSGSWAYLQKRRAKARPLQKSKEGKGKDLTQRAQR